MVRKSDRVKIPSILLRGSAKGGEGGRPKGAVEETATAATVRRRQRRRRRRQSSDRNSTLSAGLSLPVCVCLCLLSYIFVVFIIVNFSYFKIIYLKLYSYICLYMYVSVCLMPCKVKKCSSNSVNSVALKLCEWHFEWEREIREIERESNESENWNKFAIQFANCKVESNQLIYSI